MQFDELFEAYYTLYRTEAEIPNSEDDEYTIAMRLFNEAVRRWSRYDGTYWKELFTTLQLSGDGDSVVTSSTDYDAPEDFKEGGGYVRIKNSDGRTIRRYPVIEPQDVQFKSDLATYCYFSGNPKDGYIMHLNPAPDSTIIGMDIEYDYYKNPTLFTTGLDVTEMSEPYFIVHRALYHRFRGSRNPYLNTAKGDAEDALRTMQADNNSGSWANPWKLADNSGGQFGVSSSAAFGG